jgi:mannose-6-phosphate isomerase-like protein (cupin superfamily)
MTPKAKSPGWTGVHRPHTKLVDVLKRHHGQADWAETIVDDESLFAQWISMAPGGKTPRRMNGDTREWWIVQSGSLRFTVDGREPVVATKGVMVQVPYRTFYQIENVGTEPALRFEVNVTRARSCTRPTRRRCRGRLRVREDARAGGRGVLDAQNRPVVDFNKWWRGRSAAARSSPTTAASPTSSWGRIRSRSRQQGHYHEEGGEFWLVMLGKIRYKIEGLEQFEADEGDVVYVPRQTWHLASFGGQEGLRSCRLAMNGSRTRPTCSRRTDGRLKAQAQGSRLLFARR